MKYEVLNEVQQALFVDRHSKASGLTQSTTLDGTGTEALHRHPATTSSALGILREDQAIDPRSSTGNSVAAHLDDLRAPAARRRRTSTTPASSRRPWRNSRATRACATGSRRASGTSSSTSTRTSTRPGGRRRGAARARRRRLRRRRRRPDDLPVARQRRPEHPALRGPLPERHAGAAGGELPLQRRRRRGRARVHRPDRAPPAEGDEGHRRRRTTSRATSSRSRFDSPEDEARYIAETCKALRGVAIREDGGERGISWSDMAVLLRSVRRDGGPIMAALEAAGVPYVITGMDNLFEKAEVEAARQLFYFLAGEADEADGAAGLAGRRPRHRSRMRSTRAIAAAATARAGHEAMPQVGQFKVYNLQRQFVAFLENAGLREEQVPGRPRRGGLLQPRQVQPGDLGLREHPLPLESGREVHELRRLPAPPRRARLPGGLAGQRLRQPGRGAHHDRAPGQGAAVAGGVHPAAGEEPLSRPRAAAGAPPGTCCRPRLSPTRRATRAASRTSAACSTWPLTRAQKFLHMTWAPHDGNRNAQAPSDFFNEVLASKYVKRRRQDYDDRKRLEPDAEGSVANVTLSFSDLKYFFECPYQFKLRILYGFNAPLDEALGYRQVAARRARRGARTRAAGRGGRARRGAGAGRSGTCERPTPTRPCARSCSAPPRR